MKTPVPAALRLFFSFFPVLVIASLLALPARAQIPGSLDPVNFEVADDPDIEDEYVRTVVTQPDGKIIIAGKFSKVQRETRNNIARLNADGTLDMSFDVGTNMWIYSVVIQPDGKILLGGHFTVIKPAGTTASVGRSYIARLNPDGTLDTAFDPAADYDVTSMAIQPDGMIVVGGYFNNFKGAGNASTVQPRKYIARLDPAGALDPVFAFIPGDYIYSVTAQEDGKIIVGGKFLGYIVRINTDLTLDLTFAPLIDGPVHCSAVQKDGRVIIGGQFSRIAPPGGGAPVVRNRIMRLNAGGVVDNNFNPNCNGTVECLAVQTDNRILLGGSFTMMQPNNALNATERLHLARVNTDGSLDATFNPKPDNDVTSLSLQTDGKILAGGYFTKFGSGQKRPFFGRLFNGAVTEALTLPAPGQILWQRSGALQEVEQVTFEQSIDGGATWLPLGSGTRVDISSDWQLQTVEPLPANFYLRARGRAGSGNRGSGMIESVVRFGQTSREDWNTTWFGSPASTGDAAPDADPNGNGIPNLLEYALGGDPAGQTTGTAILPAVTLNSTTQRQNLTFNRYPARDDITITIQATTDPDGVWEDAARSTAGAAFTALGAGFAVTESGVGASLAVLFTDRPAGGAEKRFMRIKVTPVTP